MYLMTVLEPSCSHEHGSVGASEDRTEPLGVLLIRH